MKITYKGIGSDLKNILFEEFEKNENTLFVFENSASFFEIKREFLQNEEIQQKLGIFQNFKMMNSYDFYENVFVTDKIVVKEEKQVVLFYNALTEKLKRDMKVNNYYDIIDVAYNYYNLFAELQEYKIDLEKIELEKWQAETFGTLVEIDNEMKKVVQQKGLILPYMLRNVENISDNFLKKFSKICFVNKVKITPFEKELIGEIENRGIAVENILQLSENDFNEEKLKIKDSFSLPEKNEFLEKFGTNIEIFEYENKFSQVLGLVKKMDESENEEKIEIYSEERIKLKSEKKIYENIFINGMIDLHIKLKNKEILYDYKSGVLKNKKGEEKKEKVDNAFKQLDYYSIMLSERNSQEIEKFVVDVWNGDIMDDKRKEEEEFLNEDDILKVVKKYYETDYYDIGDVKDVQNYTYQTYKNICRREDELNDENK